MQAFARGLELDAGNPDLKEGSKQGRQLLSLEQLQQVNPKFLRDLAVEVIFDSITPMRSSRHVNEKLPAMLLHC